MPRTHAPPPLSDWSDEGPPAPAPARRSLYAFGLIAAGFWIAREASAIPAAAWFAACTAALIPAVLRRGMAAKAALAVAAVCFGGGWFAVRIHEVPRDHLGSLLADVGAGGVVTVEGLLAEPPAMVLPGAGGGAMARFSSATREPSVRLTLDADTLVTDAGLVPTTGRLRVWVEAPEPPAAIRAGDRVRISGTWEPIAAPLNPGSPDRRLLAAQEGGGGGAGDLNVPDVALVEPLAHRPGVREWAWSGWLRLLGSLRSGARRALECAAPRAGNEEAALLSALLLGEYDPAGRELTDAFTRQGLVHLLAISGFHLVVIAGATGMLVRLTGERGGAEAGAVAALVVLYLLVVPASAPVLRAGLMVLAFLAAEASGRRYDRLTVLGWISTALILWRPMDLWSLGFQLSAGIVAVLLWLGRPWHVRLWGVPLRGTVDPHRGSTIIWLWRAATGAAKGAISTSILCWAAAAPLVAHHTGIVSPLAVVTGVLLVPVVTAMLCLGYAALVLGVIVPSAAPWVGGVLAWLASALSAAVRALDDGLGLVVMLPAVSGLWAAATTAVALHWFRRGHARDRLAWFAAAAVAVWLAGEVALRPALSWRGRARIDTLAVGDGACHLVRAGRGLGGGEALLWDCGSLRSSLGVRELPRAMRALGVWHVRTAIITHANYDHFSTLPDLVRPLGIRRVLVTDAFLAAARQRPDSAAAALLAQLADRGVEVGAVAAGDRLSLGPAAVEFLWPPAGGRLSGFAANDTSLVARVEVPTDAGPRSILLTGDLGRAAIPLLLESGVPLDATVMEAPHHGSYNEPAAELIRAASPRVVMQSTGPRRAADPRWDPLRQGRTWLVTARDGAAWAEVCADGSVVAGSLRGKVKADESVSGRGPR